MAFWNRRNSSQDEAFNKAIDAIVASYKQDGELNKATAMSASNPATASLPFRGGGNQSNSSTWPNYSSMNTQTIARLTQNLAANFDKDPQYVENALAEQGLSWGDPFPPGRPLDPFYGYARPARTWDYPVGANVQLTPRQGRIPFSVIKSIHESYYASMIIVKHLIYDVCSLDYQWIPPENTQEDATEDIKKAEKFFAYPDGRKAFRSWLAEYLQDVIRYDAGALYIRRNLKGKPIALEVVSGTCYSDDTEVLTENGWKLFKDVDIKVDRFATRNPKTQAFEWQFATDTYQATQTEPMVHFTGQSLDILVTPNHRMLLTSLPRSLGGSRHREPGEVIVPAGDVLKAIGNRRSGKVRIPQTSNWEVPDLTEFVIGSDPLTSQCVICGYQVVVSDDRCNTCWCYKDRYGVDRSEKLIERSRTRLNARNNIKIKSENKAPGVRGQQWIFSGDDFAAFMGMYLAEGCTTGHSTVLISQLPKSKGYLPYKELLDRLMGREAYHTGASWQFKHKALHDYLHQFGYARDKFIPDEIKNLSSRQLEIFWEFYRLGDGHTEKNGRTRIVTGSKRMADDLQEIAQKIGYSASVRERKSTPHALADGRIISGENCWTITLRFTKAQQFHVQSHEYNGEVYCVSVPNEQLYVRRNGYPSWCCNTIMPLIDFFGRSPRDEVDEDTSQKIREMGGLWDGKTVPAYLQIIEGMPWLWARAEDMIYEQINPLPESPYGLAPLESVLMQANTDIRFQWNLLQYFTEGTIPAGFMEAPPDLTDPNQVITWQNYWDSFMLGNQARLNQVVWVPNGANFTAIKKHEFNSGFSLYLMRCTAAAYGVVPNDLGFTEDVNRSTGEIQVDVQFRVGTLPIVRFVESILNTFTQYHLGLQARIQFDTGQGTQHRLERAQADDIYIKNGTLSNDEVRMKLGRRISKKNPVPRIFDNTRSGPIPLSSIIAVSQDIDATTYGPTNDALKPNFIPIPPPGVLPPKASPDDKRAGAISSNLYSQTLGGKGNSKAKGSSTTPTTPTDSTLPSSPSTPSTPSTPSLTQKDATAGITTVTGATGVDLMTMNKTPNKPKSQTNNNFPKDYSEDEDPAEPTKKSEVKMVSSDDPLSPYVEDLSKKLHQWRMNSINRVKKNLTPRKFDDIPKVVSDAIWVNLSKASTPDQVWECFSGDVFGDVFMEKNTEEEIPDPIVAGIALVAQDTNKVVMVQRGNKHD